MGDHKAVLTLLEGDVPVENLIALIEEAQRVP
jgi:hypothetical protein